MNALERTERAQQIRAEAQEIMLEQLRILQGQTKRAIDASEGVPAMNISVISREMGNICRVLLGAGEWRQKQ